jgi:hypothetical protein
MMGMKLWCSAGWIASAAILVLATCGGRAALEPVDQVSSGGHAAGGHATTSTGTGGTGAGGTTTTSPTTTTPPTTTTWPTTTTTITGSCDGSGDCQTCFDCASQDACAQQTDACTSSNSCLTFADCMGACSNADPWVCYSQCSQNNPTGAQLFSDLIWCAVCGQCPNDCADMANSWCYYD